MKCGACLQPFIGSVIRVNHPNCKAHWVHQTCMGDQPEEFGQNRCPICNFRWTQVLKAVVMNDIQVVPGPENKLREDSQNDNAIPGCSKAIFTVKVAIKSPATTPDTATMTPTVATTTEILATTPLVATLDAVTATTPATAADAKAFTAKATFQDETHIPNVVIPEAVSRPAGVARRSRPYHRRGITRPKSRNLLPTKPLWQQALPVGEQH
ncbi:unnamed protein product [Allacma fusca]|uniref:RING-type domain-containing protein n=1 Tax=Allacma fusca TaxID=39272 RepID=A0A8J2P227_9HEXA|nr:unnamed protein product [Allacma fusca]